MNTDIKFGISIKLTMPNSFDDAIDLEEQPVYQDVPEFTEINKRLSNKLLDINNYLKNLQKNIRQLEGNLSHYNPKNESNVSNIDKYQKNSVDLIDKLMNLFKSLSQDKKSLHEIDQSLLNASQRFVTDKLNTGMKVSLSQFTDLQRTFTDLEKELNKKQTSDFTNNSGDLINLDANSSGSGDLFISHPRQMQEQMIVEYEPINAEELEYQRSLINERENEIEHITNGIEELNEIFHDLQSIVITQGDVIDNIEANLYNVVTHTRGADKQLTKADRYQKNSRRICMYLLVILCVVLLFIILVIFA